MWGLGVAILSATPLPHPYTLWYAQGCGAKRRGIDSRSQFRLKFEFPASGSTIHSMRINDAFRLRNIYLGYGYSSATLVNNSLLREAATLG